MFWNAKETLDYLRGKLDDADSLPIRIEIYCSSETQNIARELRNQIISVAKETNSQMDTEVRLSSATDTVGDGKNHHILSSCYETAGRRLRIP